MIFCSLFVDDFSSFILQNSEPWWLHFLEIVGEFDCDLDACLVIKSSSVSKCENNGESGENEMMKFH